MSLFRIMIECEDANEIKHIHETYLSKCHPRYFDQQIITTYNKHSSLTDFDILLVVVDISDEDLLYIKLVLKRIIDIRRSDVSEYYDRYKPFDQCKYEVL